MPTLSNVDKLIETWVGGLDKLITKVKSDSHMFKNMICTCELQVPLQSFNNLKDLLFSKKILLNNQFNPIKQINILITNTALNKEHSLKSNEVIILIKKIFSKLQLNLNLLLIIIFQIEISFKSKLHNKI